MARFLHISFWRLRPTNLEQDPTGLNFAIFPGKSPFLRMNFEFREKKNYASASLTKLRKSCVEFNCMKNVPCIFFFLRDWTFDQFQYTVASPTYVMLLPRFRGKVFFPLRKIGWQTTHFSFLLENRNQSKVWSIRVFILG